MNECSDTSLPRNRHGGTLQARCVSLWQCAVNERVPRGVSSRATTLRYSFRQHAAITRRYSTSLFWLGMGPLHEIATYRSACKQNATAILHVVKYWPINTKSYYTLRALHYGPHRVGQCAITQFLTFLHTSVANPHYWDTISSAFRS